MEKDRGAIVDNMIGARLFEKASDPRLHRQGSTDHLAARMDAAVNGFDPNTLSDEADQVLADLQAGFEEQALVGEGAPAPVRDEYGFSNIPPVKGW